MKDRINRIPSIGLVLIFFVFIFSSQAMALSSSDDKDENAARTKPSLAMEFYDYTPPSASNDSKDLGVIGDKLQDNQLLLPSNNYVLKLKLLDNNSGAFSHGASSIATYIEYDTSKIEITANSNSGNKNMTNEKDKAIFDSGLDKGVESVLSWNKAYYDTIVNLSPITGDTNKPNHALLNIIQSAKTGLYGDVSKIYRATSDDNTIASITFKVKEDALSASDFETTNQDYIKVRSEMNEIDVFNAANTSSRTVYNDKFTDQTKSYSKFITVEGTGRNIGEPTNLNFVRRTEVDGTTATDDDLYLYYTKKFRDKGYSITDSKGINYNKYYDARITRTVKKPGTSENINIGQYNANEEIENLSSNPNTEGTITYNLSYKGTAKADKVVTRKLQVVYLVGDVDNNGVIDEQDDTLFTNYIKRKVNINSMLGRNEDVTTYKERALDLNNDGFVTVTDQTVLRNDIRKIKSIKQKHLFLVP